MNRVNYVSFTNNRLYFSIISTFDKNSFPLNDYFAANPDIKHWDEDIYSWSAIGGKFYGVPFITQYEAANRLILMRQNWLDALHMSYPCTLDEMKAVLTAFTKNDPDGNGKNDTVGFTAARPDVVAGTTPFD